MITSADLPRLDYKKPRFIDDRKPISNIIGVDSEAYTDGVPFMICDSFGSCYDPPTFINTMIEDPRYENASIVLYNIKYDAGAILRHLPTSVLHNLWYWGEVIYNGITIKYIPHKLLRIRKGKRVVSLWDISQFFFTSLDNASKTYLGAAKMRMTTKRFTRPYVKKNFKHLKRYCVRDARLTQRLGTYLVDKLDSFGLKVPALYSCAAISYQYFCTHSHPNDVHKWWEHDRTALALACDAYEGGKFEITARGSFHGHEYDLTSAYPYEISRLLDLSNSHTIHSTDYQREAVYGYIKCRITCPPDLHLPCGLKGQNGVRYYPTGSFITTITKNEFDYCKDIGCKLTILQAAWIFVKRKNYLYKKNIEALFAIKQEYKGKDKMLYGITKIVQNSYYGKLCQTITQPRGKIIAGPAWNPFHASEITANTRITVTKIQNLIKDRCIAVHTDSVFSLDPIPNRYITGQLGGFEHVTSGRGILIACGLYQLNDINKFRGFNTPRSWTDILSENPRRRTVRIPALHVESWVEAMAKNHEAKRINVFKQIERVQALNCDTKRVWPKNVTAGNLLSSLQFSTPKIKIDV